MQEKSLLFFTTPMDPAEDTLHGKPSSFVLCSKHTNGHVRTHVVLHNRRCLFNQLPSV